MNRRGRAVFLSVLGFAAVGVLVAAVVMSLTDGGDVDDGSTTTVPGATTAGPAGDPTDPRPVAQAFLLAWDRADWSAMDAIVTDLSAAGRHAAWMGALEVADLELTLGEVTDLTGGRATAEFRVDVDVAGAGSWSYDAQMVLVWDGAGWLVDWYPGVLHPGLSTGDRIELQRRWPERAPILDSEGRSLAATLPSVTAGVIPNRVTSRADVREAFATIMGVDPAMIDQVMDAPNVQPDWFLPVVEIPRELYPEVRPGLYPVPGIAFRVSEGRSFADPGLAQHVIGLTGEITAELLAELGEPYRIGVVVGRTPSSLERTYERSLAGTPDLQVVRVGTDGTSTVMHSFAGTAARPLRTTLSLPIQRAAESALAAIENPAALVAVDIQTGEVRAAVSRPLDGFNRSVTGRYPPGSTFKLVVTLAALEAGMTPDDNIGCPEEISVGGQVFTNAASLPRSMDLAEALIQSCNTAFIRLAEQLGRTAIEQAAAKLGFNQDYTAGLATPGGSYPRPASDPEAGAAAIGQANVLATPLHMASVVAGLTGGGWRAPTLLADDISPPLDVISPEIVETIRALMIDVVEDRDGTGRNARVDGLVVGGKTGTAQLGSGEDDPLVAWFVGFSGDLAFAVMVEEGESGGRTAAPIAAAFLENVLEAASDPGPDACIDASDGWLTFQGNGTRAGCVTGVDAPIDPEVLWSADVGVQAWLNSPVIVDGLVIVGTAGRLRAQADGGDGIVALRLSDGRQEWRVDAVTDVNGVAAAGDTVFVTGDEGKVWALRASDGRIRWVNELGSLVFTNPLVVGDLVVVGDVNGTLWALDAADGSERWSKFLSGAIRGGASSDGNLIYAATDRGDVIAVDLAGERIWDDTIMPSDGAPGEVRFLGAPTIVGEAVVLAMSEPGFDGSAVIALDKFVGSELWRGSDRIDSGWSNVINSVAVHDGEVVLASNLTNGIQAVDVTSGAAIWQVATAVLCDEQWASPVVVGDVVLLPRADGSLYAFDAATRSLLWDLPLTAGEPEPVDESGCSRGDDPVVVPALHGTVAVAPDGTILVGSLGGGLYAIGEAG